MFNKMAAVGSTDDIINRSMGLPIAAAAKDSQSPPGGFATHRPQQQVLGVHPSPVVKANITEDNVIGMISKMTPEGAEEFLTKVNNRILFMKYKSSLIGLIQQGDFYVNPVKGLVLVLITKAEAGYVGTVFPATLLEVIAHNNEASTEIGLYSEADISGLLKEWYKDVMQQYIAEYASLYGEINSCSADTFFSDGIVLKGAEPNDELK